MTQGKEKLEAALLLKKRTQFTIGQSFQRDWYETNDKKFIKTKLGTLSECSIGAKDKLLVRSLYFDRISTYQVDSYIETLTRMKLYKLHSHIVYPEALFISDKLEISVIVPQYQTLYELIKKNDKNLTQIVKLEILVQLAKLMNTFHNLAEPLCHGNLNSFNVFVEYQEQSDGTKTPRVLVGEIEMNDFKRYANMFYSYKSVSISSAPECLRNPKKRADPTPAMDTYSFAMIMWELLHDQQPFDGSLEAAT